MLAIVGSPSNRAAKALIAVQTGKVVREDLTSIVTASGEIKPKVYVNIGANAFAKITHLYVKEGDQVKNGQLAGDAGQHSVRLPTSRPWTRP